MTAFSLIRAIKRSRVYYIRWQLQLHARSGPNSTRLRRFVVDLSYSLLYDKSTQQIERIQQVFKIYVHARPHIGAMGSADPPGKMDEKLKSENMQKKSIFLCLCYILRAIRAGRCRERRYADHIISDILQNAPFVVKF